MAQYKIQSNYIIIVVYVEIRILPEVSI